MYSTLDRVEGALGSDSKYSRTAVATDTDLLLYLIVCFQGSKNERRGYYFTHIICATVPLFTFTVHVHCTYVAPSLIIGSSNTNT